MLRLAFLIVTGALFGGCATDTRPEEPRRSEVRRVRTVHTVPAPPQRTISRPTTPSVTRRVTRVPAPALPSQMPAQPTARTAFEALPGWRSAPLGPGLEALRKSCALMAEQPTTALLSNEAPWAGTSGEWRPVCESLQSVRSDAEARVMIEALFIPVEAVSPDGKSRFTGYFEPVYDVRRYRGGQFTEPVPGLPADLIAKGDQTLQRLRGGRTRPYPARADIVTTGVQPLAYAHPSDVFFLQIQGSGRLRFADGSVMRAVYAAHNGHAFRSTANYLIREGKISRDKAGMTGIRNWMDRAGPTEARRAMNYNPRYIFFKAEPVGDPRVGPKGSQRTPLTPMGSLAVDNSIHPLGLPMFVQTQSPALGGNWSGLLVAQDTGNAIKGAVRGDIYFGTGPEAGRRASTQNAGGRMWVLLPRVVAQRMRREGVAAYGESGFGP